MIRSRGLNNLGVRCILRGETNVFRDLNNVENKMNCKNFQGNILHTFYNLKISEAEEVKLNLVYELKYLTVLFIVSGGSILY